MRGRNQTVPAPRAADGSANRGCRPELDELRRRRTARPRTGGLVRGVEQARPTAHAGVREDQVDAALTSEAFGALTAELRRAEANHHDLDALFPRLAAARGFEDAEDIAKVLHYRLARATAQPAGSGRTRKAPRLIVGLIPHATGAMSGEMRQALTERRELIEARADAILDSALHDIEPWTTDLGTPPVDQRGAARWRRDARTVAAYRDRYSVTDDTALGAVPESAAQKIDHARATAALHRLNPRPTPGPEEARRSPVGVDRRGPKL